MKIVRKFSFVIHILKERGPLFFVRYFFESKWFDIRYGTSTSSRVPKAEQKLGGSATEQLNGLLYVASFTSVTKRTVAEAINIMGAENFAASQFMDFGCGKGKALLTFAIYFGQLQSAPAIGIEYDEALSDLAIENLATVKLSQDSAKVVCDSAANWKAVAERETLVIYLYNSFQGETFDAVIESLQNVPHILIYVDPAERDKLAGFGYTIVSENAGKYHADTWLIANSRTARW